MFGFSGWVSVMTIVTNITNQLTITNHLIIIWLLTTMLTIVLTSEYVEKHCTGQYYISHCFWGLLHGCQQHPESGCHNHKCILNHSSAPGYSVIGSSFFSGQHPPSIGFHKPGLQGKDNIRQDEVGDIWTTMNNWTQVWKPYESIFNVCLQARAVENLSI